MKSMEGKSKFKTKINNIKINEDVKFEWKEIKTIKN